MKISVNGVPRDIEDQETIAALVLHLRLEPAMILVEHNGLALHRGEWSAAHLQENDRIEILQVAAGG